MKRSSLRKIGKRGLHNQQALIKLYDFTNAVLACVNCHDKVETNTELRKELFTKLRG